MADLKERLRAKIEAGRATNTEAEYVLSEDEIVVVLRDADALDALEAEVERLKNTSTWPISTDGPHKPDDHRVWLARQLLDSKLTTEEAYGIVCYHPAVSDIWKARAALNPTGGADEAG